MERLMQLLTGIVLFLLGMTLMGEHLHALSGGRTEALLRRVTNNRWRAALLGFGVTAVIQSSSAVTVLVVSLTDAGVLRLGQAVPVIIGSNLGTTVTAWLLCIGGASALWERLLILLLAFCGLIMYLLNPKRRAWGGLFLGLFLLLCGMEQMTAAAAFLAEMELFSRMAALAERPLLGVLAGTLFTGLLQSSSASVGLLQAFSATGRITWGMAVPLVLGQNIGTCATVLLASIGGGRNARRAAICHLGFNLAGTAALLPLWLLFSGRLGEQSITPVGVAAVHSGFNFLAGLLVLPLLGKFRWPARRRFCC